MISQLIISKNVCSLNNHSDHSISFQVVLQISAHVGVWLTPPSVMSVTIVYS